MTETRVKIPVLLRETHLTNLGYIFFCSFSVSCVCYKLLLLTSYQETHYSNLVEMLWILLWLQISLSTSFNSNEWELTKSTQNQENKKWIEHFTDNNKKSSLYSELTVWNTVRKKTWLTLGRRLVMHQSVSHWTKIMQNYRYQEKERISIFGAF